jgi:hypothetical protein
MIANIQPAMAKLSENETLNVNRRCAPAGEVLIEDDCFLFEFLLNRTG